MAIIEKTGQPNKIGVALSGGIDSLIAGWLLKQKGYELSGIYLYILKEDKGIMDAQKAADYLGISLKILDLRAKFQAQIVQPFINSYLSGQTPNPCIFCNAIIKCGALQEWALKNGLYNLVTGHYARIMIDNDTGRYLLLRGLDPKKDQSYFLYRLTQKQLSHLLFPLGTWEKKDVADLAEKIGLNLKGFQESQEICFLHSSDYRLFLKQNVPDALRPGPIYDRFGNRLGTHCGLPGYTIGQRKGLHLKYPGPHYVISIDSEKNQIIVGKEADLWRTELIAHQIHKIACTPWPKKILAQIRSTQAAQEARLEELGDGNRVRVLFDRPVRAISPGQSVVFFDGEICLGGGIIQKLEALPFSTGSVTVKMLPRPF